MTLPKARKIVVRNITFPYLLKYGKGQLIGNSGPTISLTVDLNGKLFQHTFFSKKWLELAKQYGDHEDNWPPHKVAFTPKDVRQVIENVLDNNGKLSESFELVEWYYGF